MNNKFLSALVEQVRGVSYKPKDIHDTLNDSSIALLRANNIFDGSIDFSDVIYIDRKRVSSNQVLRRGDILVCASSGSKDLVGKAASFDCDGEYTFGAFCKVVRPKNIDDVDYISLFFQSSKYKREITASALGANINNIRNEHIDNLIVNWPIKFNRDNIVRLLNQSKSIITLRKKQLQLLDKLIKARFVEMFGKNKYESKMLSEVANIIAGGDKPTDNNEAPTDEYCYPVFANGVDNEGLQCFSKEFRVGKAAVTISARGTIGATFIREPYFTPIVRLIAVIPNEQVNVTYLKYAIDSIRISGTGTSQQQLTVPNLKKEFIPMPPIVLQEEFQQFAQQNDKSKVAVQKSLEQTQLLFDSLMQQYFG